MRHLRTMLALAVALAISCLAAPLALASPNTRGAPEAALAMVDSAPIFQLQHDVTTAKPEAYANVNAPDPLACSEAVSAGTIEIELTFRPCAEGFGTKKTEVTRRLPST